MKPLVIFGSGETARLAVEYFTEDSDYEVNYICVDDEYLGNIPGHTEEIDLIGSSEMIHKCPPHEYEVFVALSSSRLNRSRTEVCKRVKEMGYRLASYKSSKSFIANNAKIGENCFILEGNVVQSNVVIGENVFLWSGNHIGHKTVVSDNCFVSSHCVISGYCKIGRNSFLGVNCTLEDGVEIGIDNFIGAGTLVRKSTAAGAVIQREADKISKADAYRLFKVSR